MERPTTNGTALKTKPVGIWIRVSTEDQAKGESPEHHEVRARSYAESKGWAVVRVYDLAGVSGKTVKDHPECQAMMADVAAGRIEALIFSKLARFARNTRELLDFSEHFREHGADLVSLQEAIDTSTPSGRMLYTQNAAMAQWEREETSERVKASVKVRAKLGKSLGGQAPFGYRWEDKRLVIDETEAPVRRKMYDLFLETKRFKTTARMLNEAGHRTRRGAKFSRNTVQRLLTDPVAKGERIVNYTESLGKDKKWRVKPESEWERVAVPAIITPELFEEVNGIIQKQAQGRKPYRRVVRLFSGLLYCACGKKMYKHSGTPKYVCDNCRNKIPEHDIERVFVEELKRFFLNPDEINARLESNESVLAEKEELLSSMAEERRSVEREMERVYRLYIDDVVSPERFGELDRPLKKRRDALDAAIPQLQGEIDALAITQRSAAHVVEEAQSLYAAWDTLTFEEKRTVVETIAEKIVVGDATVDITLAYAPAPVSSPVPPSSGVVAIRVHNHVRVDI